ncbi:MAG: hypothetical protein U0136_19030 [Bdellovibrionota bacterium]
MDELDSIREAGRLLALNFAIVEYLAGGRAVQMVTPYLADCFGAANMRRGGDIVGARQKMEETLDVYSQFMQMSVLQQRVLIADTGYDVQPLLRDARLRIGSALGRSIEDGAPTRTMHSRFFADVAGCLLQFGFRTERSQQLRTEDAAQRMLVLAIRFSTDRWSRAPQVDEFTEAHATLRAHVDFPENEPEDRLLRAVIQQTLGLLAMRLKELQ